VAAITAIDLFCGAGGATNGLKSAGARVLCGVELSQAAAATYRLNHPEVWLIQRDIRSVSPENVRRKLALRKRQLTSLCRREPESLQLMRHPVGNTREPYG
jgi:DNA (cytosine-5)-methyltransferase 1